MIHTLLGLVRVKRGEIPDQTNILADRNGQRTDDGLSLGVSKWSCSTRVVSGLPLTWTAR